MRFDHQVLGRRIHEPLGAKREKMKGMNFSLPYLGDWEAGKCKTVNTKIGGFQKFLLQSDNGNKSIDSYEGGSTRVIQQVKLPERKHNINRFAGEGGGG